MSTSKSFDSRKLSWVLLTILHIKVQAECQHEGKIYADGERLRTSPGGECKVCYCREEQIHCAEIFCYTRTDCEAKTVPGQCCPKYDHCPLKEIVQQPPPVGKVEDKLLLLKQDDFISEKSTPSPVITIIEVEGLQRKREENLEINEISTPIYEENSEYSHFNISNELKPKTSESIAILSSSKSVSKPKVTPYSTENDFSNLTITSSTQTSGELENSSIADSNFTNNNSEISLINSTDKLTTSLNSIERLTTEIQTTKISKEGTTTNTPTLLLFVEKSKNNRSRGEEDPENKKTNQTMKDVEVIKVENNLTSFDSATTKSQKMVLPLKLINKRESSSKEEADEVFRQLQAELYADTIQRVQTAEEEKQESDQIFQELFEETSTPKSTKKDRDADTLQQVTDAIAKLTLGGKKHSLDGAILGQLSRFFNSQYQHNGKK